MEWKTKISKSVKEETLIRGYPLPEVIEKLSFVETIFLVWKGELPNENEKKMLDKILVTSIDHGINPPSAIATRTVISGGNSLNAGVAAGVLTLGDAHGGAIEELARIFQENKDKTGEQIVHWALKNKIRMPGYGHKVYTTDPRSEMLIKKAKEFGFYGMYLEKAEEIERDLEKHKGMKLCLNVDGAIAAIISEMGFHWRLGKGFFIASRVNGLIAHAFEEITEEKPFRRLKESVYEGKEKRELPK